MCATVATAIVTTAAAAQTPLRFRQVGKTSGFPRLHQELQRIVDEKGRGRRNSFCLMLADRGDGAPLLFAIWRERRLLYRWNQTNAPQVNDEVLVQHEPLDLENDIVRTRTDEASTFLVTRTWVRNIDRQCRVHGRIEQIARQGG